MNRRVEIFEIDYSFLPSHVVGKNGNEIFSKFIQLLNQIDFEDDPYEIKYNKKHDSTVIIELLENDSKFLFGIIGKLENLRAGLLKRLREVSNKEVIEEDQEGDLGLYLENYTYFYVCKKTLFCSVLSNSAAPRFMTHFENFLKEHICLDSIKSINVNVVIDDKINYKINEITNIGNLELTFSGGSKIGSSLLDLGDSFHMSQNSVIDAKVSLNLESSVVSEGTRTAFDKIKEFKDDFRRAEITGTDESDNPVFMELINQILLKEVDVNIDDKLLTTPQEIDSNLRQIKKALAGSLISI